MISTTYIEIALQKGFDKVLYLFPASDETFVLLVHRNSGTDVLVHCDSYGKALKEVVFEEVVSSLAVPSGKEAIVLRTRKNCIFHMELEDYATKEIPFQFMQEDTELSKIHCFS